jgi:hypothetical protein
VVPEDTVVQPYVIRQGDFLLTLAHQFGFDADGVWNDDKNKSLRDLRADQNILFPSDVLYIPDSSDPDRKNLDVGSTNSFVSDPPQVTLTHKFVGPDPSTYASKACTIQELEHLTGLQTDGSGVVTFSAPVTLSTATVTFTETGESYVLAIGGVDPINTLPGIFQRLQGLGYIDRSAVYNPSDIDYDVSVVRAALVHFNADQGGDGDGAPPAGAAAPNAAAPGSPPDAPPAPASPSDAPAANGDYGAGGTPVDYGVTPATDNQDSGPDSPPADQGENVGIEDDGTLDVAIATRLAKAYGC